MITYLTFVYFALGLTGVIFHTLIELSKLNKASNCTFSIGQYFKLERFNIIISVMVCGIASFMPSQIQQLNSLPVAGLIIPYISIGYMGQSILIAIMGKVNKIVNVENKVTEEIKKDGNINEVN